MNKQETREVINFMNALYPNRKLSLDAGTIDAWNIMFEEYSKNQVINSIKRLSKKIKFIPNIAEILDEIENDFFIQTYDLGRFKVVRVIFHDEDVGSIPFNFDSKEEAINFINSLKRKPPKAKELLDMYVNNVKTDPKVIGGLSYDK